MRFIIKNILCCFFFFSIITNLYCSSINKDSLYAIIKNSTGEKQAKAFLSLATVYIQLIPDSSLYYAGRALVIAQNSNDIVLQAKSYSAIAEAYQRQLNLQESIKYYLLAVEVAEANNEKSTLGTSYNGLGISYYYLNDLDKSEFYLKKAAASKLEMKDYTFYTVILTNLAGVYYYKERYQDAIDILLGAENILINAHQEEYLASLYNSLGGAYQMGKAKSDSAEYYYKKSLAIALEFDVNNNIITAYHNLGDLNFRRKKYLEAIVFLKKAEEYCNRTKENGYSMTIYSTLSEVYDSIRDYKNAYHYKRLELEQKNALFKIEKQKAIDEMEIKYQTAKKEKEIEQQKEELQSTKLEAERATNKQNRILFISFILLLTAVFVAVYFWQRKKANQLLEKEKTKLFENIVHEIRTPLTLINGPLQLVKKEMQNGKMQEHIQLIEQNSEKLIGLVNELLDASKLEKGKYQLAYQYGDINEFIRTIISGFEKEAERKQIVLNFFPLNGKSNFKYAANAIEKIVSNVLSNAVKYCPSQSTVKININIDNDLLLISISDDGPGIPEKEQQKIFDRFYRLKSSENINGTGIGLALVKDLVDLMKGEIIVQSDLNKGTTFKIVLPVEKNSFSDDIILDDSKPLLLIVEDDADLTQFVCSVFEDDFNISKAINGVEAIEKINLELPNIILTDIMMPLMNGIELLQEVKSNPLTNHIPVVVFSAKSSLESRIEGLKHGADAYVPKPFNPDELTLVIQNLLTIIKRNQQEFQNELKEEKLFDDRVKSKNEYVNQAIAYVVKNIENPHYSVNELASDLCISRSQLHRKLNTLTGFSTTNFIKMVRLEKAKDLLQSNAGNVTEIAYACGFSSQSYFTKMFTEYFGESPSKFM